MARNRANILPLVIALAVIAVPAAAANLKPPKSGEYAGESGGVTASVRVSVERHNGRLNAFVIKQVPGSAAGEGFTRFEMPGTCDDGTSADFAVFLVKPRLKISKTTGRFREEQNEEQPTNGGNVQFHSVIEGKISGSRASGTVEFTRTVNDPSLPLPSCTSNGPLPWTARHTG